MPSIIVSNPQARWKDSYSSIPRVKLTLRANGEEKTQIYSPGASGLVPAGFDAPTAIPTVASGGVGNLTNNTFVGYRYVYASSQYPFVDATAYNVNASGGGELWPRSNPSPASAIFSITGGAKQLVVTVTRTTQTNIDWIWIYRTPLKTTQAEAETAVAAGELYYSGRVANVTTGGTTTYTDNTVANSNEIMEADNFAAPTFWRTWTDGTYYYGWGNPRFIGTVFLDGTSDIALTGSPSEWFDGRNGQVVTFNGVTSGGFDGKGSFYWKWTGPQGGKLYSDAALTLPIVVPWFGATRINFQPYSSTLWRSKPLNPFSWGVTDIEVNNSNSTAAFAVRAPRLFAENLGGGYGTAIATISDDQFLKLDLEEPTRTLVVNLATMITDTIQPSAVKPVDNRYSCSSHFAQFIGDINDSSGLTLALDTKSWTIMVCNGDTLNSISSPVFQTLESMLLDNDRQRNFFGLYVPKQELNCWWVKRLAYTSTVDTLIWCHGPTGAWGTAFEPDMSAAARIYDPVEGDIFILGGDELGNIFRAFDDTNYRLVVTEPVNPLVYDGFLTGLGVTAGTLTATYGESIVGNTIVVAGGVGTATFVASPGEGFDFQVGERVYIWTSGGTWLPYLGGYTVLTSRVGDSFTFTATDVPDGTYTTMLFTYDFTAYVNQWCMVQNLAGGRLFGKLVAQAFRFQGGIGFQDVTFNPVYDPDTDAIVTTRTAASSTTSKLCISLRECRVRRYFDLGTPSEDKRTTELWLTAENVDADGAGMFARFYKEYAGGVPTTIIEPERDTQQGGVTPDSVSWLSKSTLPSDVTPCWGHDVVERGYEGFILYNQVVKAARKV